MNYRHVYMLIVEHAKSEMEKGLRPKTKYQKSSFPEQYFEFHHILPKVFIQIGLNENQI